MRSPETYRSAIYFGQVMHKRLRPFTHRFAYRVFSLYLDLDEIETLSRSSRVFSHNRFNLLSFFDKDHGDRNGAPLRAWATRQLASAGITDADHSIRLLCFPRVLGYVFNPLSIWYCYGTGDQLRAVIYEVSNTFGQRHSYVIPVTGSRVDKDPIVQLSAKRLYVSPFIGMRSHYRFRLREPDARLSILIRQWVDGEELLVATQTGHREAFKDRILTRAFFGIPFMSLKVIAAIHWQALKIWLKGGRIEPRPSQSSHDEEATVRGRNELAAE